MMFAVESTNEVKTQLLQAPLFSATIADENWNNFHMAKNIVICEKTHALKLSDFSLISYKSQKLWYG